MAVDMDTYMKTLAWAAAVLVMKQMIIHLLVVRARVSPLVECHVAGSEFFVGWLSLLLCQDTKVTN